MTTRASALSQELARLVQIVERPVEGLRDLNEGRESHTSSLMCSSVIELRSASGGPEPVFISESIISSAISQDFCSRNMAQGVLVKKEMSLRFEPRQEQFVPSSARLLQPRRACVTMRSKVWMNANQ